MTDITNKQLVAIQGENIIIMNPIRKMTKEEALVHAAWLVALANDYDRAGEGDGTGQWDEILAQVLNT
jgi:hypothetical protein